MFVQHLFIICSNKNKWRCRFYGKNFIIVCFIITVELGTLAFILNIKETINVTNTRKILVLLERFSFDGTVKKESKRGRGKYGQKNGDNLSI